jgi:ketosteroid isomerase-like protein
MTGPNRAHVAETFFDRIGRRDIDGAFELVAPDATARLQGVGVTGTMKHEGRAYFDGLARAFPDLYLRRRSLWVSTEGVAVVEITIEGTQADDFFDIVNIEKHMDLDQAWLLTIGDDLLIHDATGYWCELQLYRRLGVKRLDRVNITQS